MLKRPMGRPRGRPPGSTIRSSRGRPTSITSNPFMGSMFDQNSVLEYFRKCQKDLFMQYSKTLGLQQMAQMTMNQNSFAQNTLLLQAMQQMGLLNPQFLNANFALQNLMGTKGTEQLPNFEHLLQAASSFSGNVPKKSSNVTATSTKASSSAGSPTASTSKTHNIPSTSTKPSHTASTSTFNPQHKTSLVYMAPDNSKFKSPIMSSYQVKLQPRSFVLFFFLTQIVLFLEHVSFEGIYKRKERFIDERETKSINNSGTTTNYTID